MQLQQGQAASKLEDPRSEIERAGDFCSFLFFSDLFSFIQRVDLNIVHPLNAIYPSR